jgi:hypothetical protein
MKVLKQHGHQGDTQWFELEAVPAGAKPTTKQFIAASERSGSFHALFGNYNQYEVDGGVVVETLEECILNHSLKEHLGKCSMNDARILPKKDHRHAVIPAGKVFFVGIHRKADPLAGTFKRVID